MMRTPTARFPRPIPLALLFAAGLPLAAEPPPHLREGQFRDVVERNCMICHSLDYVEMNAGILDRDGWQRTVEKMVNAYGAPVIPEDQQRIVDYLERAYGR